MSTNGPNFALNPFKLGLWVSAGVCIPSYISLILFSFATFHITYKHQLLLDLYLSVLFYLLAQLLLLLAITASWLDEILQPEQSAARCRVKLAFETFAILLPGYCILMITLVRSIFVGFPLRHVYYLKSRYQVVGLVVALTVSALIALLPSAGVCGVRAQSVFTSCVTCDSYTYCSFEDLELSSCKIFSGIFLGVGFCFPIATVLGLYIYIYHVAVRARKSHRQMIESSLMSSSIGDTRTKTRVEQNTIRDTRTKERAEQTTIPWSIITTVTICITTTLPWGVLQLYNSQITEVLVQDDNLALVFDLFYAALQALVGLSPLAYLLTTNSLRVVFLGLLRRVVCGKWCGKARESN